MDIDTELMRRTTMTLVSPGDDLSLLSVHELKERIALLKAEIERADQALSAKRGALSQAESVFRS